MMDVVAGFQPIKSPRKRVRILEKEEGEGDAHRLCLVLSIRGLVFVDRLPTQLLI
jgi:hypothetical protein